MTQPSEVCSLQQSFPPLSICMCSSSPLIYHSSCGFCPTVGHHQLLADEHVMKKRKINYYVQRKLQFTNVMNYNFQITFNSQSCINIFNILFHVSNIEQRTECLITGLAPSCD